MPVISTVALILFCLGLLVLLIVGCILRSIFRQQKQQPVEDETRLVQDMFRTVRRLEERVQVLETLLAARQHQNMQAHSSDQNSML